MKNILLLSAIIVANFVTAQNSVSIEGKWESKKIKNLTKGGDWYNPSGYQLLDLKADGTFGTENEHHGVYTFTYIGNKLTLRYLTANLTVHATVLSLTQTELHWRSDVEMDAKTNTLEYIWERVGSGGGSTDLSKVTFWVNWYDGDGNINVNINRKTESIDSSYSGETTIDGCNEAGCANFTLSPGTYYYTASNDKKSWQGTITLSAGQCRLVQLERGGSGGGSATGKISFFTSDNLTCPGIYVTINGTTKKIDCYRTPSDCDTGAYGCANFTLPVGSHDYSAYCGEYTWEGTITIKEGGCIRKYL